jgi:hypothetical protein
MPWRPPEGVEVHLHQFLPSALDYRVDYCGINVAVLSGTLMFQSINHSEVSAMPPSVMFTAVSSF